MQPERFAVIGDPITHSLSPGMQNAAFNAAGIGAYYEAVHVAPAGLGSWIERSRQTPYRGFNVTIPHKETIVPYLDAVEPVAAALEAVNTVVNRNGSLHGYNTDVPGFAAALACVELNVRGHEAAVFGSGGAARAVVFALVEAGAEVTVINRDPARAHALVRAMEARLRVVPLRGAEALGIIQRTDILVNATPLGMADFASLSPLPAETELQPGTLVIDLVYGRRTPLLAHAEACGCRTLDGLEMLVQQGAASFRIWTGLEPDLSVMREACRVPQEVKPCSAS
jgi:shikimate dehydrogenase